MKQFVRHIDLNFDKIINGRTISNFVFNVCKA